MSATDPRTLALRLIPLIKHLRGEALGLETRLAQPLARVPPGPRDSARNLAHYLALRQHDIRPLQEDLARLGLSRLARAEAHTLASIDAVLAALHALSNLPAPAGASDWITSIDTARTRLAQHTHALLGAPPAQRRTRIMVTMPSDAAADAGLLRELLIAGMDVMRINCAHDDADAWLAMIRNLRAACAETGRTCRVHADLAGPKLRTGDAPDGTRIRLHRGDALRLVPESRGWIPAHTATGEAACVPCTLDAVFGHARAGQRIAFDDGKIHGEIVESDAHGLMLRITRTGPDGSSLRPGKGINLPDTVLPIPALTASDAEHLALLTPHLDMVGLSFTRNADDVRTLHEALHRLGERHPEAARLGVVYKIETREGFENLPRILLAALCRPPFGVMVARGDLAVEVGFERMAEVQEEILWLTEAAHTPVIWATQVLERMAKRGQPTRAEVSDAAHGVRAEAVMLNKGPYIVETVSFLDDILRRMGEHHIKRRAVSRRLAVSAMPADSTTIAMPADDIAADTVATAE